jgi:hypothetical protein
MVHYGYPQNTKYTDSRGAVDEPYYAHAGRYIGYGVDPTPPYGSDPWGPI